MSRLGAALYTLEPESEMDTSTFYGFLYCLYFFSMSLFVVAGVAVNPDPGADIDFLKVGKLKPEIKIQ